MLPGHLIRVKLKTTGAGNPTNIRWTIPAPCFKSYTATGEEGKLIPLTELTGSPFEFYWAVDPAAGTPDEIKKTISVKYEMNGSEYNATATFDVTQPRVGLDPPFNPPVLGAFHFDPTPNPTVFVFGDPATSAGFKTIASVHSITPKFDHEGEWGYFQILDGTDIFWAYSDTQCAGILASGKMIDKSAPTKGPYATGQIAQFTDSPTIDLHELTIQARRFDQFALYIMFKPPHQDTPIAGPSAWVPLGITSWYILGCGEIEIVGVTRIGDLKWQDNDVTPWAKQTIHPEWTGAVQDLKSGPRECLGPCGENPPD